MNITAEDLNRDMVAAIAWVSAYVAVEMCVGFFGNVIVIYVFFFRYPSCNFRYFVLCLAFMDIISVFITMPGEIITQLYWYVYPQIEALCKIKSFFNMFTVTGQALCLCVIAYDRYRKLCQPHGWQIRTRHALLICLVICIASAIMSSPVPALWGINTYIDDEYNVEVSVCEKDDMFDDTGMHTLYMSAELVIIPLILLTTVILYILLFKKFLQTRTNTCRNDCPPIIVILPDNSRDRPSRSQNGITSDMDTEVSRESLISKTPVNGTHENNDVLMQRQSVSSNNNRCTQLEHTLSNSCRTKDDVNKKQSDIRHSIEQSIDIIFRRKSCSTECLKSNNKYACNNKLYHAIRMRRKTKITLTLSIVFTFTVVLYLILLSIVARDKHILRTLSNKHKALLFFGLRFVFINHVINPFLYWFLDMNFRRSLQKTMKALWCHQCC
ncbi:hypothetical protein DPMN_166672 [Dreissena polymorpha]|uniref:G-protein coupled receptors family 1 profile domain-containing protein n=1 Tax=Dreissena polymorpha TaxID=45954 RepID=A0A9D4IXT6_DREPO|nr:hypothetical protein DPMN_166672 [Dreissena polymorpha]